MARSGRWLSSVNPARRTRAIMRRRLLAWGCRVGLWLLAAMCPSLAFAADAYETVSPRRLLQRFDFEDRNDQGVKLGRGLSLPQSWYVMGREPRSKDPNFLRLPLHDSLSRKPGFPPHNKVGFSGVGAGAASDYSLHLSLNEGNAGAFVQVGALPAVAGSDYLVTARVRTRDIKHAAARGRAYLIDAHGRRIEASVRQTDRLRTNGDWTEIDLKLPGEFSEAAYIGLEVELVQPTSDPLNLLGNHQVVLTDVHGEAWFDDLAVWQLPHVQISTGSAVNITRGDKPPFWDVAVRDLVGGNLAARLTLYDVAGRVVTTERRPMGWGAPSSWRWTPDLPAYGWYLAELSVLESATAQRTTGGSERGDPVDHPAESASGSAGEVVVASTYNATLWLPGGTEGTGAAAPDRERFALVAEGMSDRDLKLLPDLMEQSGIGAVILSAWDAETTLGTLDLRLRTLHDAIVPLRAAHKRVELSFHPVPEELEHTRGVNTSYASAVFESDESVWMPYVQPILVRQGQRVNTWQVGSVAEPVAATLPNLPATLARLHAAMRQWTPGPVLGLPWRIDQPMRPDVELPEVSYAIDWPPGISPGRLGEQLGEQTGLLTAGMSRRLHIKPESAAIMPHPQRAADLAIRMVRAWEQDRTGVAVAGLWTRGLERRDSLLPDPLLGVLANVSTRLGGYRPIGEINLGEDRVALVFEQVGGDDSASAGGGHEALGHAASSHDGGMIVAWNLKATGAGKRLVMKLGQSPVVYDIWGNATRPGVDERGRQVIDLEDSPVFITGIDPKLAMFRGGFSVDEPFVPSIQTPHTRVLRLKNPWPITITGQVTLTGPAGWTLRPYRYPFSIAPGRTLEVPVAMQFPVHELSGSKRLTAEVDVTADRRHVIELSTPLELGLEGVRLEASLTLEPSTVPGGAAGAVDAAVTCIITNTGDEDLSLNAFATLPRHPRKERLIPRLEPGQSVIRQFRFNDAGLSLGEADIRLGVRQTNGPAVLNKSVGLRDAE